MGLGEATEVPVEAEEAVTGRPAGSKAPTALIIGNNILQRFVVFHSNCQYFDGGFWEGHNLDAGHATKLEEFSEKNSKRPLTPPSPLLIYCIFFGKGPKKALYKGSKSAVKTF